MPKTAKLSKGLQKHTKHTKHIGVSDGVLTQSYKSEAQEQLGHWVHDGFWISFQSDYINSPDSSNIFKHTKYRNTQSFGHSKPQQVQHGTAIRCFDVFLVRFVSLVTYRGMLLDAILGFWSLHSPGLEKSPPRGTSQVAITCTMVCLISSVACCVEEKPEDPRIKCH